LEGAGLKPPACGNGLCEEMDDQEQGDRIGRNFAYWAIVYFGHFFENYKSGPKFWATFFHELWKLCIDSDKKVLGYILGERFKNSSGHPDQEPILQILYLLLPTYVQRLRCCRLVSSLCRRKYFCFENAQGYLLCCKFLKRWRCNS
jgi:hypothetical protein